MIGSNIQINDKNYRIINIISEGGYGFVYLVENEAHNRFALKKVITQDPERYRVIVKELKFLQEHAKAPNPYFITFYDSKTIQNGKSEHTFYILLEFGPGGTLFDIMAKRLERGLNFTEPEIIGMVSSISKALKHIHDIGFVYCDMKIENCLFFDMNTIKLCDFGSVNTFDIDFATLPKNLHYQYEEIFEKETTLMYRPPEMCDPYLKYRVNQKADMWMFGCVIYTLMFFKHPFFESSKLAITSASFNWPAESSYSEKLENLVRNLMTPDPSLRPSSSTVVALLENWQNAVIDLNEMAADIKLSKEQKSNTIKHLGDSLPLKKSNLRKDHGFDSFDFSGFNKISKKPVTPVNQRPQEPAKSPIFNAVPLTKKSHSVINDDVFTKINKKDNDFDFFAKEDNNEELKLEFGQPAQYDFDCFGEPEPINIIAKEFDDLLGLDIVSEKPQPDKKVISRNDLDDLDFCNY